MVLNLGRRSLPLVLFCNQALALGGVDVQVSARKILSKVEVQEMKRNANDFCNNIMAARSLQNKPVTESELSEHLKAGTLGKLVEEQAMKSHSIGDPWLASLLPSENIRLRIANKIPMRSSMPTFNSREDKYMEDEGKPPWQKRFVNLDEAIRVLSQDPCEFVGNANIISDLKDENDLLGISSRQLATRYACQELLGILKINSCEESFDVVQRLSAPKATGYTGMDLFRNILENPRYDEGLRKAAVIVARRVQSNTSGSGDYFSDLKQGFLASGANDEEAEEMAWNVAGALASAGPNVAPRLKELSDDGTQTQKRLALNTIGACLPILDHRSSRVGSLYSFPKDVSGSCNSGKSYHFWYPAFLARRSAIETRNPEASAAVAFQGAKLYQIKNRGSGRKMARSPVYSGASQIVRADLSYAAAGALYGAHAATGKRMPVDIDGGIVKLIETAGAGDTGVISLIGSKFGGEAAEIYFEWNRKFNANSVFSFMNRKSFAKITKKDLRESLLGKSSSHPRQDCRVGQKPSSSDGRK